MLLQMSQMSQMSQMNRCLLDIWQLPLRALKGLKGRDADVSHVSLNRHKCLFDIWQLPLRASNNNEDVTCRVCGVRCGCRGAEAAASPRLLKRACLTCP
jgi:hypothetical protein